MEKTANGNANVASEMSPRRPGFRLYIKRGLLGLVMLLIVLPLMGFGYEGVMAGGDAVRFPPPGQLFEVNGHTMHIHCTGEGSPTVIFEAGFGAWSDAWTRVQPGVSSFTRSCSYDRAGLGWSDVSNEPRTQQQIAIELHALLAAANIQPPYILVGHSMAGKSIRLFAALYPEAVAGLVFVDARHESMEPKNRTPEQNKADEDAYVSSLGFYGILRQSGIARVFGVPLARSASPNLQDYPDEVIYRLAMFGVRETTLQTMIAESHESSVDDDRLSSSRLPSDLPVFVLTADDSLAISNWETGQQNLAALTTNSQWVIVPNSSHTVQDDQPQAVVDATEAVVEAARTSNHLGQS